MNISFLPLQTHSPPHTPPQPPPQDLIYIFAPIPAVPQKHPPHPLLPLSSGDPRPFPCAFQKAALFAVGNGRALQPKPSVTDVGFATLTSLQGIPLPPSSSGILSLHAIPFATSKEGQAPAGCSTSLSLGHLASIFPLLNNLLEQTKNKQRNWLERGTDTGSVWWGRNFLCFLVPKFSRVLVSDTDFQGTQTPFKLLRSSAATWSK